MTRRLAAAERPGGDPRDLDDRRFAQHCATRLVPTDRAVHRRTVEASRGDICRRQSERRPGHRPRRRRHCCRCPRGPGRGGRRAGRLAQRGAACSSGLVSSGACPADLTRRGLCGRHGAREREAAFGGTRRVRTLGGILPLVRRTDRAPARIIRLRFARWLPDRHDSSAGRAVLAHNAVELPALDVGPQGRCRPGGRVHCSREVSQGDAADCRIVHPDSA